MDAIIENYNKLVPVMERLDYDGLDIWDFHDIMSGFGFEVLLDGTFIRVHASEDGYYVSHRKMTGRILMGEELGSCECGDASAVYNAVLRFSGKVVA